MADPIQDSLLREIDEDLRQERYAKLWKQYGNYVIGAAIALVIGVAAYQGWQSYQLGQREKAGAAFAAAMRLETADPAAAREAFRRLAAEAPAGYRILAGLREAALAAKSGDVQAAVAADRRVAEASDDRLYRDLAELSAVLAEMDAGSPPMTLPALEEKLAPLAEAGQPWEYTAKETLAFFADRAGERQRARQLFEGLANNAEAPPGIRARAEAMLTMIAGE